MLRAVLLGLLVVSGSACGKASTETSAKVTPGAAGKVLEAKGSVTIKQADATRPLAVGEAVLADDVVITGADGNVVIELAHNSARWELGPNKQTKVSDSIAWNAKKETAQAIDEATAAAGRPAERSAAGTVATAEDEGAKADMATEAAMAPTGAPVGTPAPEPDMSPKGGSAPPRPRPPRRPAKGSAPSDIADDEAPRRTRGKNKESAKTALGGPGGGGIARGGGSVGGGDSLAATESKEEDSAAPSPGSQLAAKSSALHACMVDHGAKDDVTLTVEVVSGKATVKLASKAAISAALDKCLKGVVSGIQFTGSAKLTKTVKP